jgi:hypothetical protein
MSWWSTRDRIEQGLISGLQREVLRADVAAFALAEFKRQLRARLDDTRSHLATMRNKRETLKTEIANLTRAIAEGRRSAAPLDELGKRERELDSISEKLVAADGRGLDARSGRLRNPQNHYKENVRQKKEPLLNAVKIGRLAQPVA